MFTPRASAPEDATPSSFLIDLLASGREVDISDISCVVALGVAVSAGRDTGNDCGCSGRVIAELAERFPGIRHDHDL
jgi:hypothetical protein